MLMCVYTGFCALGHVGAHKHYVFIYDINVWVLYYQRIINVWLALCVCVWVSVCVCVWDADADKKDGENDESFRFQHSHTVVFSVSVYSSFTAGGEQRVYLVRFLQ